MATALGSAFILETAGMGIGTVMGMVAVANGATNVLTGGAGVVLDSVAASGVTAAE